MDRSKLWRLGYRLTTAEILYHLPDHRNILQAFIWQELDLAPRFPMLHGFLEYWERNLEGKLHSVKIASTTLITPKELSHADISLTLH